MGDQAAGWDNAKPWTIPAETFVLYRTDRGWRFAVANAANGFIDGHLRDLPATARAEEAMQELVDRTQQATGHRYEVEWTSEKTDWWTGRARVAS